MIFKDIALQVPKILLPTAGTDLSKWAIIACDQYTSEPEYWQQAAEQVGSNPSTLNIIFPEVYLEDDESDDRIAAINRSMQEYLDQGILEEQKEGFILVDRKTSEVESRKGLMVALDLEQYDFSEGATTLIRATEGTIVDRLPPRIRVRENAPIELPHIMVLIDDPERTVIEPLFDKDLPLAYDVPLMLNGGHVKGWQVSDQDSISQVKNALVALADPDFFAKKYEVQDKPVVLYAMGDGNHSFATAKAIWEELKKSADDQDAVMNHPARFALVELVNVHDPGLEFEAIHRVVFDIDADDLLTGMAEFCASRDATVSLHRCADQAELAARQAIETGDNRHLIPFVDGSGCGLLVVENPAFHLTVATLQSFLDNYLEKNAKARIDYIHGEEPVARIGGQSGNIGFFLPSISKHDLFKTIILDGALPRKTFSMGEADEKRFYLECRKII
ncbi:MAG: DUF1015 domain-containing protein [Desulfuromonas sp.]|nr:MAG: DUF1015 domain-containing protein [Desulfuromonas sp.]